MPPPTPDRQEAPNPVLVLSSRGDLLESFSRGAFVVTDREGGVVASLGAIDRWVFPRSAVKLIQAIPLVESGAADAFKLEDRQLALACASHSGEGPHIAAVAEWLSRIGARAQDLVCGAHPPYDAAAAAALIRDGVEPTRLHNNCSGKHTGFLTLSRHLGAPLAGYNRLDHRVQVAVVEALSALSGTPAREFLAAIDGCGAPNFAVPLRALARALANIADPSSLSKPRSEAVLRLRSAARANPFFTAGTGRLCTRIMVEAPDIYAKAGADGVYVAALPVLGLGLALKIDDGGKPASEALLIALLVGLGALDPASPIVKDTAVAAIRNTENRIAGVREAAFDLLIEALSDFSPQALAAASAARPEIDPVGGDLPL
jgi:L-asparaginase II